MLLRLQLLLKETVSASADPPFLPELLGGVCRQ
jgi:hypothetical protein